MVSPFLREIQTEHFTFSAKYGYRFLLKHSHRCVFFDIFGTNAGEEGGRKAVHSANELDVSDGTTHPLVTSARIGSNVVRERKAFRSNLQS